MTKDEIMKVRYSQVLTDPFPEHSFYDSMKSGFGFFDRLFGILPPPPESISIHAAYMKGYDKAYSELLAVAKDEYV